VFGFRIVLRGLRDTIDHILVFVVATLAFWVGIASIVFAPTALLALFHVADPRHGIQSEAPTPATTIRYVKEHWLRSWALGLATIPVVALLFYNNMVFYGRRTGTLSALTPLWLVLFVLGLMIALASFSACALLDRPVKASLRLGFLITGKALPRYALVAILVGVLALIGAFLIVPVVLFLPATIAAILNRMMLSVLDIPVPDPNLPTPELLAERAISGKPDRFGGLLRRR
jgi:uncharacterized membrane protein YesL